MSSAAKVGAAGAAMIAVTYGFGRYGYGVFAPRLIDEFHLSVTAVGVIASVPYAGYLLALVLVGVLSARLGPRPLVLTAGLSAAVGTALVAGATGPVTLVAGLTLAGTSPGWAWAPFSDTVDRVVPAARRNAVLGLVASGTAFGIVVTGPLALALTERWRLAWVGFAVLAAAVTVANARVLPSGPGPTAVEPRAAAPSRRRFALYLTALSYGFVGAVYWTFAVTAIERATGGGAVVPAVSWGVLGVAGTAAAFTGAVVTRLGLRTTHMLLFAALAVAIALLGIAPAVLGVVALSVVLYGAAFMAVSGLLAMWSYRLSPDRPTRAFSVTVFFLGVGSIPGPALLGAVADGYGLRAAFLLTAGVTAATLLARPAASRRPTGQEPCLPARSAMAPPTSPPAPSADRRAGAAGARRRGLPSA